MSTHDVIRSDEAPDAAEVRRRALDYLSNHHCMSLATDGPEGLWAATVFYVNDGFALHFLSSSSTRHSRNLAASARAAATISEDVVSWRQVAGIQLEGPVARVDDPRRRRSVLAAFHERYVFADSLWWTDGPRASGADRHVYRLEPIRLLFLDHGLGSTRFEVPATLLRP